RVFQTDSATTFSPALRKTLARSVRYIRSPFRGREKGPPEGAPLGMGVTNLGGTERSALPQRPAHSPRHRTTSAPSLALGGGCRDPAADRCADQESCRSWSRSGPLPPPGH